MRPPTLRAALLVAATNILLVQAIPSVLVYTYTAPGEFRHDSIPTAIQVLGARGPGQNVSFTFTE
jgi:hypothetical protein